MAKPESVGTEIWNGVKDGVDTEVFDVVEELIWYKVRDEIIYLIQDWAEAEAWDGVNDTLKEILHGEA